MSVGFIGIIIIYQIAIKETMGLHDAIKENESKAHELEDAPKEFSRLQEEMDALTKNMGTETGENEKFREQLLEKATTYCHTLGITLQEFPQAHTYIEADYTIQTYSIIAEGNFLKLQKLVYLVETGFGKGKVPSTQYYIKTDFKTGRKSLFLKLVIQYITKNEKHEKGIS